MRKILGAFILIISFCQSTQASFSPSEAEKFIKDNGNKTIQDLTDPGLNKGTRRSKFNQYLDQYFSMSLICQNLVGRYWKSMSSEQKEDFISLYKKMIENIFLSKFQEYQGASLSVTGSKKAGKFMQVLSDLSRPGQPSSKVIWVVSSGLKILDIQLEGLSIFRAHRDDFRNSLSSNGGNIATFLKELRQKVS